jgi:hypothetical protein
MYCRYTLLLLAFSCCSFGQNNIGFYKNVQPSGILKAGVGVGLSFYGGDLQEGINPKHIRYNMCMSASYRLTNHFSVRGELRHLRLSGSHEGTRVWYNNLSFRSDNFDLMLAGQLDLKPFSRHPFMNPYLIVGAGGIYFNPKAYYKGSWVELRPLLTEANPYSRLAAVGMAGLGISFNINSRWSVGAEMTQSFSSSDYLDDVSNKYPDLSAMSELARALSDRRPEIGQLPNATGNIRGNPNNTDWYGLLTIRAEYLISSRLGRLERRKLKCL